ncbi:MAG TPA: hypothetical protein VK171_10870 [Fimbriimonas sp.]|nr:hypothetical protein [Fimbriimonas sp.]
MSERRFNEKEIAEILRKAAAAQAESVSQSSDNTGFTQSDLERLAAEVGIDPKHIAGAVDDLGVESGPVGLLKGSSRTRPVLERTFDGTVDDVAWEEMVAELRLAFGGAGVASEVGSSRDWAGGNEFSTVHLSATPRNGKTRVRMTLHQEGPVVIGCLLSLMASLFGSMAVGIPLGKAGVAGPLVFAAILGLLLTIGIVANLVIGKVNRKNLKRADAVLARLKKLVPNTNSRSVVEANLADAPTSTVFSTESQIGQEDS